MQRRRLVLAAMLGLAGCTATPQWSKPNATQADLQRDAFECEREAEAEHAYSTTNPFGTAAKASSFDRCMQSRGWTPAQ